MTPAELYQFDTAGYLVVPNVLGHQELERYNARADSWSALARARRGGEVDEVPAELSHNTPEKVTVDDPLSLDDTYLDLIDHPRLLPFLWDTVLMPRFKSNWLTLTWRGGLVSGHGSHTPWVPYNLYQADRAGISCFLLNVMWALSDITPGGGGLTVVPGSHKSHFPVPPEGPAAEQLVEITAAAGSVILFSHDIYHQSLNRSDRERRVMFLTYCPSIIANSYDDGDGRHDRMFDQAPEGSWLKYLLRRPHGYRELYPQPARVIAPRAAKDAPQPEPATVA